MVLFGIMDHGGVESQDSHAGRTRGGVIGHTAAPSICPYDVIRPICPDTQPISDNDNDWVQLSRSENTCVKYFYEKEEGPEWGINGDKDADMVSQLMRAVYQTRL